MITTTKSIPASFNNNQQQSLETLSEAINKVKDFGTPASDEDVRAKIYDEMEGEKIITE
ncbi:MAG: hypothetical protein JWO92_2496 [Chitinophagaceae bacterium]|nr:hypothetical protein [Chitinophagaceae bacterium]